MDDGDTHDTTAGTERQATRGPLDRLRGTLVPGVVRRSLLAKILLGLVLVMALSGLAAGYFYLDISDDLDEEALAALEAIVEQVGDTNRGVQEISQATEDQADSTQRVVSQVETVEAISDEVADQTDDVAAVAQQQTAVVTRIVDSTDSLKQQADALVDTLEAFEVGDSAAASGDAGAGDDSSAFGSVQDPVRDPTGDELVANGDPDAGHPEDETKRPAHREEEKRTD